VGKLPYPPARLVIPALSITIEEGTLLWRVYRAGGRHPMTWNGFRSFGPIATGRFDHHGLPPSEDPVRAMYYASDSAAGAIVETFQDSRFIDRLDREPWIVAFELRDDFVGLDLTGAWPTLAGASQAISSGRRDIARAWSRLIWGEYEDVDGLWYPSAMAGHTISPPSNVLGRRFPTTRH
jgi:RES domain